MDQRRRELVDPVYLIDDSGVVLWTNFPTERYPADYSLVGREAWYGARTEEDRQRLKTAIGLAIVSGPQSIDYRFGEDVSMSQITISRLPTNQVLLLANVHHVDERITVLTNREKQVLTLGVDLTTQQIADRLGISASTVDSLRRNAGDKLGLAGPQLVRFAVDNLL